MAFTTNSSAEKSDRAGQIYQQKIDRQNAEHPNIEWQKCLFGIISSAKVSYRAGSFKIDRQNAEHTKIEWQIILISRNVCLA